MAVIQILGLVILFSVSLALAAPGQQTAYWSDNFATAMQYQNEYDKVLDVQCDKLQGMYRVASEHSNKKEDRRWSWHCRDVVSSGSGQQSICFQTGYVNDWDDPLSFMCPVNQYIAGVYSYHRNRHEDRRWKFTCCVIPNKKSFSCRQTGYVNDWDNRMDFVANQGEVITGAYSYHSNKREDRRWKFTVCQIQ